MKSIKRQLLVFTTIVLCVGAVGTGVIGYYQLKHEMDELFDENMMQLAQAIAVHDISDSSNFSHVPEVTHTTLKGEQEFLIQIWRGSTIFYSSLPAQDFPYQGPGGVRTVWFHNQKWRYYGLAHGDDWLIQVSQPIPLRHTVIAEIYTQVLIPLLIQLPVILLLIWFIINRGFNPLARISSLIAGRNANNLAQLPQQDVPAEVAVMVDALNGLLERLAQAMASQRQFTSDAAHELRSPLTVLRLELDILKRATTPEERAQALENLYRAIDRCAWLVHQLLELARQEPQLSSSEMTRVSLGDLVKDAAQDLTSLAHNKHIDLGLCISGDVFVMGQHAALKTMVTNLINNAISYTLPHGKVLITVRTQGDLPVLIVADNGLGIAPAHRVRIFDRFYRILDSQSSNTTGSGLGLAIVKAVAEQHHATIEITDGLDGTGTAFVVTFHQSAF